MGKTTILPPTGKLEVKRLAEVDAISIACEALSTHFDGKCGPQQVHQTEYTKAVFCGAGVFGPLEYPAHSGRITEPEHGWEAWMVGPLQDSNSPETAEMKLWLSFARHYSDVPDHEPKLYGELLVQDCEGDFMNVGFDEGETGASKRYNERRVYGTE